MKITNLIVLALLAMMAIAVIAEEVATETITEEVETVEGEDIPISAAETALDNLDVFVKEISFPDLEQHQDPKLIMFVDSLDESTMEIYTWLEEAATELAELKFDVEYLRCEKQREENSAIFGHPGFGDNLPLVFVQAPGEAQPSVFSQEFNRENLIAFAKDALVQPDYETVQRFESMDQLVAILREVKKPVIMKHYEEWCGHCRALKPKFAKAAMQTLEDAVFMDIECSSSDEAQAFCTGNGVRGFPTVKAFVGSEWVDYQGDRNVDDLIKFAADMKEKFTELSEEAEAELRKLTDDAPLEDKDEPTEATDDDEFEEDDEFDEDILEGAKEDSFDVDALSEEKLSELQYANWDEWTFSKLEKNTKPMLVLFQDVSEDESVEFDLMLDGVLAEIPEWTHPVVRIERGRAENGEIFAHFPELPFVFIIPPGATSPQPFQGDKTAEALRELIVESLVEPDYSAVIAVETESKKDLEALAREKGVPMIVKCYEEWCGHCKALKPHYAKAAMKVGESALVYEVHCSKNDETQALCKSFDVKGYPTMKVFNGKKWSDYEGARSPAAIIDALMNTRFVTAEEGENVGEKVKGALGKGIKGIKNLVGKNDL